MQEEIPLFQKIYDLYRSFYEQIDHLPKKSRVILSPKIEEQILELLEPIVRAEKAGTQSKLEYLNEASVNLDFLKILIRLLYELKVINQSKYLHFQTRLQEIGRMLGGWIKSLK